MIVNKFNEFSSAVGWVTVKSCASKLRVVVIGVARGRSGGLDPQREWKKICTTVLTVQKGQI